MNKKNKGLLYNLKNNNEVHTNITVEMLEKMFNEIFNKKDIFTSKTSEGYAFNSYDEAVAAIKNNMKLEEEYKIDDSQNI